MNPFKSNKESGDWATRRDWKYDEQIFCVKCGSQARLIQGFCEWNLENWECTNPECRTIMEVRVSYTTQKNELTPIKCTLEKVF
jgi:hypothetical protein